MKYRHIVSVLFCCLHVSCVPADASGLAMEPTESAADVLSDPRFQSMRLRPDHHVYSTLGPFVGGAALSGDGLYLAVGGHDGVSRVTGSIAVSIYHRLSVGEPFSGAPSQTLIAPSGYVSFGDSLAWADNGLTLAVGARTTPGVVAIFSRERTQVPFGSPTLLTGPDQSRTFGGAIAWIGPSALKLLVGDVIAGAGGAAYLYERTATNIAFSAPLQRLDGPRGSSRFGHSVAALADGSIIAVGDDLFPNGGAVHLYRASDPSLRYPQVPFATIQLNNTSGFGFAIALNAELLIASAPFSSDGRGAVYWFRSNDDGSYRAQPQQFFRSSVGFGNALTLAPNSTEMFASDTAYVDGRGRSSILWNFARVQ